MYDHNYKTYQEPERNNYVSNLNKSEIKVDNLCNLSFVRGSFYLQENDLIGKNLQKKIKILLDSIQKLVITKKESKLEKNRKILLNRLHKKKRSYVNDNLIKEKMRKLRKMTGLNFTEMSRYIQKIKYFKKKELEILKAPMLKLTKRINFYSNEDFIKVIIKMMKIDKYSLNKSAYENYLKELKENFVRFYIDMYYNKTTIKGNIGSICDRFQDSLKKKNEDKEEKVNKDIKISLNSIEKSTYKMNEEMKKLGLKFKNKGKIKLKKTNENEMEIDLMGGKHDFLINKKSNNDTLSTDFTKKNKNFEVNKLIHLNSINKDNLSSNLNTIDSNHNLNTIDTDCKRQMDHKFDLYPNKKITKVKFNIDSEKLKSKNNIQKIENIFNTNKGRNNTNDIKENLSSKKTLLLPIHIKIHNEKNSSGRNTPRIKNEIKSECSKKDLISIKTNSKTFENNERKIISMRDKINKKIKIYSKIERIIQKVDNFPKLDPLKVDFNEKFIPSTIFNKTCVNKELKYKNTNLYGNLNKDKNGNYKNQITMKVIDKEIKKEGNNLEKLLKLKFKNEEKMSKKKFLEKENLKLNDSNINGLEVISKKLAKEKNFMFHYEFKKATKEKIEDISKLKAKNYDIRHILNNN